MGLGMSHGGGPAATTDRSVRQGFAGVPAARSYKRDPRFRL